MAGSAAHGVVLTYVDSTEKVGNITGIGSPTLEKDIHDVTTHDSANGYREHIGGLKDGGEIAIEGNHVPGGAGQAEIYAHFNAASGSDVESMTIVLPDGSNWAFEAICKHYKQNAPHDGKLTFSCTLKVSEKPVFAAS